VTHLTQTMMPFFNSDFSFIIIHILELSSKCMYLPRKLIQCKTKLGISHLTINWLCAAAATTTKKTSSNII